MIVIHDKNPNQVAFTACKSVLISQNHKKKIADRGLKINFVISFFIKKDGDYIRQRKYR